MTSLASLLTHPLIRPLGWTLLHFLWQGAAVALLLAGALRLLRDQTANARYVAACVALLLMAAAPGLTLLTLKPPPRASSLSSEFAQHPIDRLFVAKSPASGNRSGENAKSERSIRKPGNQEAAMPDFLVSWIPHQISGTFALSHFRAFATKYRSLAFQVRGRALERFIPVLVAAWL